MPQSLACINVHFIWSTKNRERWITSDLAVRLYPYWGGIVRERGCVLSLVGGMPDHVLLLVSLGRTISVADLVRDVKSVSSQWIHTEFPALREFAWQAGYGAFAVSLSGVPDVRKYIDGQADHHRVVTFQDEYRAFLRRHEIEWDERYVWD
jgi:putative transposase